MEPTDPNNEFGNAIPTHINAYYAELVDAETALAGAKGRVESLKEEIRTRGGVVPGEEAPVEKPVKVKAPKQPKVSKSVQVPAPAPEPVEEPAPVEEPVEKAVEAPADEEPVAEVPSAPEVPETPAAPAA